MESGSGRLTRGVFGSLSRFKLRRPASATSSASASSSPSAAARRTHSSFPLIRAQSHRARSLPALIRPYSRSSMSFSDGKFSRARQKQKGRNRISRDLDNLSTCVPARQKSIHCRRELSKQRSTTNIQFDIKQRKPSIRRGMGVTAPKSSATTRWASRGDTERPGA